MNSSCYPTKCLHFNWDFNGKIHWPSFKCFCTPVLGKNKASLYVLSLLQAFLACLLIKKKKKLKLSQVTLHILTLAEFALLTENFQNLHIALHINNQGQKCFGLFRNYLYFTDMAFTHLLLNCIIKIFLFCQGWLKCRPCPDVLLPARLWCLCEWSREALQFQTGTNCICLVFVFMRSIISNRICWRPQFKYTTHFMQMFMSMAE